MKRLIKDKFIIRQVMHNGVSVLAIKLYKRFYFDETDDFMYCSKDLKVNDLPDHITEAQVIDIRTRNYLRQFIIQRVDENNKKVYFVNLKKRTYTSQVE